LAEYVKFLPEVMSGAVKLQRELFYMPLVAVSLGLALLASRPAISPKLKALFAVLAIPTALLMLPPAWRPADLLMPEFRTQTIMIAACLLAVVPGIALTRHFPDRLVLAALAALAIVSATWPAWAYLRVRPAIEAVYTTPLPLGWGFWLNLAGFLALAVVSLALILPATDHGRRR
jgi:hypothetical protein